MNKKMDFVMEWGLRLACLGLTMAAFAPEAFARAGGGRNSGGGGILYIILMPFLIIYGWYVNRRINAKARLANAALEKMAAKDPAWDEAKLVAFVSESFYAIEKAWCGQDLQELSKRLTPVLLSQWKTQIDSLKEQGQRNVMDKLSLEQVGIVEVRNYPDRDKDNFTACLDAGAEDYTVNESGAVVDSNAGSRRARNTKEKEWTKFREFWTFQRKGDQWLLLSVDQENSWKKFVDAPIVDET